MKENGNMTFSVKDLNHDELLLMYVFSLFRMFRLQFNSHRNFDDGFLI